ncbi:MAG: SprT family zinc-dependent metalloprotease [Oscillospiraceae bacterium]
MGGKVWYFKIMSILKYNNNEIEYSLTRKKVKNINLRIKPDGKVYISADKKVPIAVIENFIVKNFNSIIKFKNTMAMRPITPEFTDDIANNDLFCLWGKTLAVQLIEDKTIPKNCEKIEASEKFLTFYLKDVENSKRKLQLFDEFQKSELTRVFEALSESIHSLPRFQNLKKPVIKLRKMKACWGICHHQSAYITMNAALIYAPLELCEYVMLHEYSHFIEPNHSKRFYAIVAEYMPDWKIRKTKLNSHSYFNEKN